MSVHAGFEFGLQSTVKLTPKISLLKIINNLLDHGWTLQRDGHVSYLPLGDEEDGFNWTDEVKSIPELMKILREKEQKEELIGISMYWMDSEIGADFLFYPDGNLSVRISGNKKMLFDQDNLKITDVNWYLIKLLPVLNKEDVYIEYFSYLEHI